MAEDQDIVEISAPAVVMTEEEGSISGKVEVALEGSVAKVRNVGTSHWLSISDAEGNVVNIDSLAELVELIESGIGKKDIAGNAVPFEG